MRLTAIFSSTVKYVSDHRDAGTDFPGYGNDVLLGEGEGADVTYILDAIAIEIGIDITPHVGEYLLYIAQDLAFVIGNRLSFAYAITEYGDHGEEAGEGNEPESIYKRVAPCYAG